jgi:membrane protease YdiL (CAAX protease family)
VKPCGAISVSERLRRWLTWQRVPVQRIRIVRPGHETRVLLAYALFYILLSWLTGLEIRRHPMPMLGASYFTHDVQYALLFKFAGMMVIPAIWFLRSGYTPRDLLPEWRLTFRSGLSILLSFAVAALFVNRAYIPGIRAAIDGSGAGDLAGRVLLGIAVPLFAAGIPEEFVYRGLLQTRLERTAGRWTALLVTAALFTAWHLPTRLLLARGAEGTAGHPATVMMNTALPVFLVALFLGWLWDRYRSLLPLIALHWGIDLLPSLSAMLGISPLALHR